MSLPMVFYWVTNIPEWINHLWRSPLPYLFLDSSPWTIKRPSILQVQLLGTHHHFLVLTSAHWPSRPRPDLAWGAVLLRWIQNDPTPSRELLDGGRSRQTRRFPSPRHPNDESRRDPDSQKCVQDERHVSLGVMCGWVKSILIQYIF